MFYPSGWPSGPHLLVSLLFLTHLLQAGNSLNMNWRLNLRSHRANSAPQRNATQDNTRQCTVPDFDASVKCPRARSALPIGSSFVRRVAAYCGTLRDGAARRRIRCKRCLSQLVAAGGPVRPWGGQVGPFCLVAALSSLLLLYAVLICVH